MDDTTAEAPLDDVVLDDPAEGEPSDDAEIEETEIVLEGDEDSPPQGQLPQGLKRRIGKLNQRVDSARAETAEANAEIERLKRENQLLQMQQTPQRPTLEQFDYDEAKYRAALADFEDKRLDERFSAMEQRLTAAAQPPAREDITALESHYDRAEKLGVRDYEVAEDAVIEAIGQGTFKEVVSSLNESEKVVYFLGKNPSKLNELSDLLRTNPVKGTLALGRLEAQLRVRPKQKQAPAPDADVAGDSSPSSSSAWQKKLDKLRSSDNYKARDVIELKRQAREAGVDVT